MPTRKNKMIKAVIFDMYETLITHFETPLYFGSEMSKDMGIEEEIFIPQWRATEDSRTKGKYTTDEVVEKLLKENGRYEESILKLVMDKRIATKEDCFNHLNAQIIPMLDELKNKGIKVALISNCFSEEAKVIRKSVLFPYFDVVMLSCEQGMRKPDEAIYLKCLKELELNADECLYVGDGGGNELDTARKLNMKPLQALWYLKEGSKQPVGRLKEFEGLVNPLDIFEYIKRSS